MNDKFIIRNAIKCKACGEIIESFSRHDYKVHEHDSVRIMIDGGHDYTRRSADDGSYEDLTVYSTDPFEVIRTALSRGTFDKNKNRIYILLCDMSNAHIEACIKYNEEKFDSVIPINEIYREELKYRKEHGIYIEDDYDKK